MIRYAAVLRCALAVLAALILVPAAAHAQGAQGSITGVVKDTSGAVLPGVTVEVSSPTLTEKTRTVVSDGSGQYRVVGLPPGTYSVTFTLPGFNTYRREGIEIVGDFTAKVDSDMKVGALEETITVSGEAPIVDVQGVQRQKVLTNEIVEAVPTGKYFVNLGVMVPGVRASCSAACQGGVSQDTGGAAGDSSATLVAHGSRFRDQRISINNMTVRGSTGYLGVTGPNIEAMQETQIDTSGADASVGTGGVRINVVPKDGGNKFAGGFFATGTNEHFQAKNISQELIDRGLQGNTRVKTLYDVAPTFGGPIKKDKVWFFLAWRRENNPNYAANLFANANKNAPNGTLAAFTYVPDLNNQAVIENLLPMAGARITWQANSKNKFAASYDYRDRCQCPNLGSGGTSPDAAINFMFRPQQIAMVTWSSPVTNRLLLEATAVDLVEGWGNRRNPDAADVGMIQVTEQNPPAGYLGVTTFHGSTGGNWTWYPYRDTGFNATYVTGAHAFKAGIEYDWGWNDAWTTGNLNGPITSIRVNSATAAAPGVPVANQFTVTADPTRKRNNARFDGGAFVQDKWTHKRVTLQGGLRLDYFSRYTPEITEGPSLLLPNRNITFPEQQVVRYKDLNPRLGAAWDLFGTGKTAVKVSLNRYTQDLSLLANSGGSHLSDYQNTASRTWTDSNKNGYPDCDFTNPALQNLSASGGDICAAFTGTSANFNQAIATSNNDPATAFGWNHRGSDWEFSTSVQQEIVPRKVAVDVAFFRRWYGNFTTTDNLVTSASDYGAFSVVVPTDSRLPQSGQTISGFLDANQNVASLPTNNFVTFSSNYGKQQEIWQGVDAGASVRLGGGTLVQGGISTGKNVTDNCAVIAKVPEATVPGISLSGSPSSIASLLGAPFCRQETPWLTGGTALATYTIPKANVLVSGVFQTTSGPQLGATLVVPCGAGSAAAAQLGRNCTATGGSATVNIVAPGTLYGDRLYQTDFRVGKVFRFSGGRRATPSVDLYNLFNGNAVLQETSIYTPATATTINPWRTPTRVQQGRLLKFTVSMNF